MRIPAIVALPLLLVALPIALAAGLYSKLRGPRTLSHQQVVDAISNALDLDDSGNHDKFDLFLSNPIADPYFESLRQECLTIARGDSKPAPGRDFGPDMENWLRGKLVELQLKERVLHDT